MMNPCTEEEYYHKLDNMVVSSTQFLRLIFKKRWKAETGEEWKDEEGYIQNFLSRHCNQILKIKFSQVISLQKNILLSSENWDMSLMSLVLLKFGDSAKHKVHNQAVRQLQNLRNDLAHHKSKKITHDEYCAKVKTFKEKLQILEVADSEINKLMEESSVSSTLESTKRVKVLEKNAEKLMKMQKFESALKQYSEALTIPGLLPVHLREIYEKRAACYLSITDESVLNAKHTDQAVLDVEQALKLNESSWNALYLKAQCHRKKNNLPEAIRYYEMALAKNPFHKLIRKDLDTCIILHTSQNFNARLNLDELPKSLRERLRQQVIDDGSEFQLQSIIDDNQNNPGFLGDQYYHGWEVPQNYKKAFHYYTIADKQGDAQGSLKLARAYVHGHGVEQDVKKGFEWLKQCAGMNAKEVGDFKSTPLGFNEFVATAEFNIGQFYEGGLCVEKSIYQAAFWYTKAMKHGLGMGATSMGLLYNNFCNGDSLLKRQKMAEMCWKQGIIFNCSKSAEYLVKYYRFQSEQEMARIMLNIAREMGSSKYLEMSDETFSRSLRMTKSNLVLVDQSVTRFEKEKGLGNKGMTLRQRFVRMNEHLDPSTAIILGIHENSGGEIQQKNIHDMWAVRLKACFGSQTAIQIIETVDKILELNKLLEIENDSSKVYKLKVVNLYYESMLQQNHLLDFVTNKEKFRGIVAELFNKTCEKKGEEQMKIRLCYVRENLRHYLESKDDLYAIGILKEGLRRYPDNYGYYCILIDCLKIRRLFDDALQYVDEALKKFPEKVDLLYEKAELLIRDERNSCEVVPAFETFLCKAPRDHRFVPEAYYVISFAHMEDYLNDEQENTETNYEESQALKLMHKNFKCAKDAEKDQLPCYLPYGVSDVQLLVADFIAEPDKKVNSKEKQHVLEQKVYLESPVRSGLILQHRERLSEAIEAMINHDSITLKIFPVKLQQNRAKKMSELKSITLQEMNPTKHRIYANRILDLTIIEEPNPFYADIEIIAEDENGDTTRVYIDNLRNEQDMDMFHVGCRFALMNPYMWYCETTGINGIRINQPRCIVHLEKLKDMCRFCGEENAAHKCSHCKWLYCSTECQTLDRKLFDHENTCRFIPKKTQTTSKIKGRYKRN